MTRLRSRRRSCACSLRQHRSSQVGTNCEHFKAQESGAIARHDANSAAFCCTCQARFALVALTDPLGLAWSRHRAVILHAKQIVDHRAVLNDRCADLPNELDLLLPKHASAFEKHDASVKLTRRSKLLEIADVRRDENPVLLIRALKQLLICCAEDSAIAYVIGVNAFGAQLQLP